MVKLHRIGLREKVGLTPNRQEIAHAERELGESRPKKLCSQTGQVEEELSVLGN